MAMLPGKERENVSYGGKSVYHSCISLYTLTLRHLRLLVIMPPSALAHLTSLDLQSPWKFKLSNPANSAASTHAGVLEFIAQEGVVHLPYWMMKTLRLNEGDPIRITGAELPKGKMVKLQAQSVHFLEVSDPKAVCASKHPLRVLCTEYPSGLNRLSGIFRVSPKETPSRSHITR
jgi:ubiquitin fusion degradation protein 1